MSRYFFLGDMYDIWKSVIILGGLICAVISSEEP